MSVALSLQRVFTGKSALLQRSGFVAEFVRTWLAIFVPKYRRPWRGSDINAGTFTRLGFSMVFLSVGLLILSHELAKLPLLVNELLSLVCLAGFGITALGSLLDCFQTTNS